MRDIIRSTQSEEDLIAIWQYVALEGKEPDAADRLLRKIDRRIEMLAKFPLLGEQQSQFGEQTRRIIVGNYIGVLRRAGRRGSCTPCLSRCTEN